MTRGRSIAVGLLLALLAAIPAGCGGGSSDSEDALRGRLEAGAAKLARAPSLRSSTLYQVESDESAGAPESVGCINTATERGHGQLRLELLAFDLGCEGGSEGHAVVMIGDRAWVSTSPERWAAARISGALPKQLTDERAAFKRLLAAATDIRSGAPGTYSTAGGDFESGPGIEFTAPASSFSQVSGTDSTDVSFRAVIDRQGYLRELTATAGEEGQSAIVTELYEDIRQPQQIHAPAPGEVAGPVTRISSRADLEALLGSRGGL